MLSFILFKAETKLRIWKSANEFEQKFEFEKSVKLTLILKLQKRISFNSVANENSFKMLKIRQLSILLIKLN